MDTNKDLIRIKDSSGDQLFIGDYGYIGVNFIMLSVDRKWSQVFIHKTDLGHIIEVLTKLHERNEREISK